MPEDGPSKNKEKSPEKTAEEQALEARERNGRLSP